EGGGGGRRARPPPTTPPPHTAPPQLGDTTTTTPEEDLRVKRRGRSGGRDRGYIVLTRRGRGDNRRERSLLHCTEVVINLVGAAPVAQFIEGPSCGQEGPGACRSKRLVAGEHPPDRLAQFASDDDRGDLAATLPACPAGPVCVARARGSRRRSGLRCARPRSAPYMGGAGESRAGVDRIGCGSGLGCECGGPALHGRSRWRRRRSDGGCGGSFQTGATLPCRALCWSAPQTLPSGGPGLASDRSGGLLELGEDVVGAAGDLARDGQGCALAAGALLACEVEGVVGATPLAGVVGGLDERPSKLG